MTMKLFRRFWNWLAVSVALIGLSSGAVAYYFVRPASHEISRAQFETLLSGNRINQGRIVPTPYAGIFHVEGDWQLGGREQPFSITTHLDAEQLKSLAAQPKVVIELPGSGLKDQWLNIVSALVLVALVVGL